MTRFRRARLAAGGKFGWRGLVMLALGLATVIGGNPAQAQQYVYTYAQRLPMQYDNVLNLGSLAVLPFQGSDGANFSAALGGELQGLRVGTDPLFTVRTEEGGAPPGKGKNANAAATFLINAGKSLGVKGVVWGNIIAANVSTTPYKGTTTSCSNNNCSQVPVDCINVAGTYTVIPKIYNVTTGQLVFSEQIHKETSSQICGGLEMGGNNGLLGLVPALLVGHKQQALTPDAILSALRAQAVKDIGAKFTPQTRKAQVAFKTRAPEFDKATQVQFANAIDFLKSGRPDRACGQFEAMGTGLKTPQISLLYNLAACREVNGNLHSAQEYYAQVDSLETRPDPMVNDALKRMGAAKIGAR